MAQGDMPYTLEQAPDGKWCIYDKASGKKVEGEEYNTRPEAMRALRMLLKSAKKDKENKAEDAAAGEEQE